MNWKTAGAGRATLGKGAGDVRWAKRREGRRKGGSLRDAVWDDGVVHVVARVLELGAFLVETGDLSTRKLVRTGQGKR